MLKDIIETYEKSAGDKADKPSYLRGVHAKLMDFSQLRELSKDSVVKEWCVSDKGTYLRIGGGVQPILMYINERDFEEVPVSLTCFGNYEQEETEMVLKLLEFYRDDSGFTVLDVGANVGWYTLNIKNRFPSMQVHSFEPGPITYARLIKNLQLNGFDENFAHNIGFYKENGRHDFYYDEEGSGASSLVDIRERSSVKKIPVDMVRMDEWAVQNGLGRIDFIKCDVEGAELFVYQGSLESIRKYKPIVFSEMLRKWSAKFGYHPNDIIVLFKEIGYGCYVICDKYLQEIPEVTEETVETNYFFLHRERHAQIIESIVKPINRVC